MKKKIISFIILAAVLAGGLIVAIITYNMLSSRVAPDDAVGETVSVPGVAAKQGSNEQSEKKKKEAYDFTMLDTKGEFVKLSDHYDKPVVLNFWASWCPPCRSEMPAFNKLYEEKGDAINIMMVNLTDGYRETTDAALSFKEENGYSFPVYFDTKSEGANGYGIMSIPTTVFIYPDGTVMKTHMGAMSEGTLYSYVDELLRGDKRQ